MKKMLKKFTCFVAHGTSSCGVFLHTPPQALARALHLKLFEHFLTGEGAA